MIHFKPIHRLWISLAVLLATVFAGATSARADVISFGFGVCEDAALLANPADAALANAAAGQPQHTLMVNRNMPYIELRNTSAAASITSFSMTIGDTLNNFDFATLFSSSPGVTFTVTSPDSVQNGARGDVLNVAFTGFTPGNFVRFQVDLDKDSLTGDQLPDYRNVFFDVNGVGEADNSVLSLTFAETGLADRVLNETLPDFVDNQGPIYVGAQFRAPGSVDHVMAFTLTGDTPVVPEPSSLVLLGCGAIGLVAYRYRRRARRSAP